MNEVLFPLVSASPDVRNHLGTNPIRFFEFGTAPQGQEHAYATWQVINGNPDNLLSGPAKTDSVTIQIDVWAPITGTARLAAAAIRSAIEEHADITAWRTHPKSDDAEMYRFTLNASFILDN